jgi:hypothetical protein
LYFAIQLLPFLRSYRYSVTDKQWADQLGIRNLRMKKTSITLLLSALLAGNVLAANVNVPFINKLVPAEGLTISYDTTNGTQKIVCIADNFYKGWLYITENGTEKETSIVYGNYSGQEFYFTNVGSNISGNDVDQFHVDKSGYIKLKDTHYKPHQAYASCFYIPETNK